MRPLVIGPEEEAALRALAEYAANHPLRLADLRDRLGTGKPVGEEPGRRVDIPFGFTVCFTIEEQPVGWCRHASFAVASPGRTPNPMAIDALKGHLGFAATSCLIEPLPEGRHIYIEDGPPKAINLIELLRPEEASRFA